MVPKSQPVPSKDTIIVYSLSDYQAYVVLTTFVVILFQPLNNMNIASTVSLLQYFHVL